MNTTIQSTGLTRLTGGRVLDVLDRTESVRDVWFDEAGVQSAPAAGQEPPHEVVDVAGQLVAPGIIDLHGDAFERSVMPRPGVAVPIPMALADNAAQLLACGITTSMLSATDGWEPGLRSRETLRSLVAALGADSHLGPDVLLHVRHETTKTDEVEELESWLRDGHVALLSLADHTPGGISRPDTKPSHTAMKRSGLSIDELTAATEEAVARRPEGQEIDRRFAEIAHGCGVVVASHDAKADDDFDRDMVLGVGLAEFPRTTPLAERYRAESIPVLMGAPNLVRGGSHLKNPSVAEMLRPASGDVLCSDYHYPSLLHAPFVAARDGFGSLAETWRLVSLHAARAAGLDDRGAIEPGRRADLVVIDDSDLAVPRVAQVWVDSRRCLAAS